MAPRKWMRSLVVLPLLLLLQHSGLAQAVATTLDGSVSLTVRRPDGQPLRDHALNVYARNFTPNAIPVGPEMTDGQGRVTMTVPVGLQRLRVIAPGVGFGSTGTLAVTASQVITAPIPPLAPFAQISGVVPPALRLRGASVQVNTYSSYDHQWDVPPAPLDAQGRFILHDVYPGQNSLSLEEGFHSRAEASVRVAPGEIRTGVILTPRPAYQPMSSLSTAPTTVTLSGTVTDTAGHPIPNAEVSAQVPKVNPPGQLYGGGSFIYGGPMRPEPPPMTARTDADGRYVIPNVVLGDQPETIPLVAMCPGYPPATTKVLTIAGQKNDLRGDLVLSTQHTALRVRVLRGGQPLAGATVLLSRDRNFGAVSSIGIIGPMFGPGDVFDSLDSLTATTGPDGETRFVDLTPGLWNARVSLGQYPDTQTGAAEGVSVQAGRPAACTLTIDPLLTAGLSFQVLSPQGLPAAGQPVIASLGDPAFPSTGGTTLTLDAQGQGHLASDSSDIGLQRLDVRYRDFPMPQPNWYPDNTEPYFQASALVAVSPALPPPAPLALEARRYGRGSIRVRLEDASGRPARGTVVISGFADVPNYAATTDANGMVVFPQMTSGKYTLEGFLSGNPTPPLLASNDLTLPPDSALKGQNWIEPQTITVATGKQARIVLRAQPMGYVRGQITPLPGTTGTPFSLYPGSQNVGVRVNVKTGEFVYGPAPPGKVTLYLSKFVPGQEMISGGSATVDIVGGQVVPLTMTPVPDLTQEPPPVTGVALMHDGQTPAWCAQAVLYQPGRGLTPQEPTDALGRLPNRPADLGFTSLSDRALPASAGANPTGPVLIAWMPGLTGATIVSYVRGQAAHIVLPAPLVAQGRITVGGRSVQGLNSTFRVRAAYQGQGILNALLTQDITAQPDGSFILDGLTPGTYLIQAARDGIWLSQTQTLTIGSGTPPPISLDIGPPGVPVVLHLTDARGRPLPGRVETLDTPPGPLADLLWPRSFRADGAGDLHLDGLTAGPHELSALTGSPISFNVPPVAGAAPTEALHQTVVLSGPGRNP